MTKGYPTLTMATAAASLVSFQSARSLREIPHITPYTLVLTNPKEGRVGPDPTASLKLVVEQTTQQRLYLPRAASQLRPRLDVECSSLTRLITSLVL